MVAAVAVAVGSAVGWELFGAWFTVAALLLAFGITMWLGMGHDE